MVTIVCLPLLLLDLVSAGGSDPRAVPAVGAEVTVAGDLTTSEAAPAPVDVPVPTTVTTLAPVVTKPAVAAAVPTTRVTARAAAPAPVWTPPSTVAPAPPPPPVSSGSDAQFLSCVRARESGGNYAIVDASGNYMGAYQFSQSTWDGVAARSGRGHLVGIHPNNASPADQDAIAFATLAISGRSPWGSLCG